MIRKTTLLLLIAWTKLTQGQTGFEKIYTQSGSLQLVELNSHNLLIGIGGGPGSTGLSLTDPEGNIIQTNSYGQYPVLGPAAFQQSSDNEFYFVSGYASGSCNGHPQIQPVVGKMDSLLNISALHYYELNEGCQSLAIGMEVTQEKSVLTWGWENSFFALKADSNLAHVWSRHFERPGKFQFIKELPSGDLLAGINMDTAGAAVARMDADGNFLWCKSYIRPAGVVQDCLIESDSAFIITGVTDEPGSANQKLFMLMLNGVGDVQWCKGYDMAQYWSAELPARMIRANDGNYAVLATSNGRAFLMKTDQNGDTLWTRSVANASYGYETSDLLASSDGGYLLSGFISGDLPNGNTGLPYIFKADSLGHMPCSEKWYPIQVTDLFPTDSSFALTSVDGATTFPISVGDTIFDPITVYDACDVTNTVRPTQAVKIFKVRPNPNTGHFTVEFEDPLMFESYYSVYDAMGKLLYQRPLAVGTTTAQIDLSRFGKGTYVIKLTDPEGVRYERVVVE